jgi:hypothetical protein
MPVQVCSMAVMEMKVSVAVRDGSQAGQTAEQRNQTPQAAKGEAE